MKQAMAARNGESFQAPWPLQPVTQPERAEPVSSSATGGTADEIAQTLLGLLEEMEASLGGSHKAVLTGDGLLLENCTREQARLHRALEMLLSPGTWPGTAQPATVQKRVLAPPRCAAGLAAELLAAEWRVLQATRVQAALLRRARQFRRILANLVAAKGAPCGAWFGENAHL